MALEQCFFLHSRSCIDYVVAVGTFIYYIATKSQTQHSWEGTESV
jgi:hypothetical protein